MFRWLMGRGATRRQVQKKAAAIAPGLWREVFASFPFLHRLADDEQALLREKCAWFLASKTFDGAHGLVVSDAMALAIAMQACLPILYLDNAWYEGWTGIVVYPGSFVTRHEVADDAGVVHRMADETFGEAWEGGPLVLSWQAARPGVEDPAMNVVIHEFAHKLDMAHGEPDGMPHLGETGIAMREWQAALAGALHRLRRSVDLLEAAIGPDVDPESPEGQAVFAALPLDAYAATDEAEFFAVSSEVFFLDPARLQSWQPRWYALLARFYRQDPAAGQARLSHTAP